jgi:hypothetical protein
VVQRLEAYVGNKNLRAAAAECSSTLGWAPKPGVAGSFISPEGETLTASELVLRAYWATMEFHFGAPSAEEHINFFKLRIKQDQPVLRLCGGDLLPAGALQRRLASQPHH